MEVFFNAGLSLDTDQAGTSTGSDVFADCNFVCGRFP